MNKEKLNLPEELDLGEDRDFILSEDTADSFYGEITEYLTEKYGYCIESYGLELKVVNIEWDTGE